MTTGARDGRITVWDIDGRGKLLSFPSGHEILLSLAITQDGTRAISGGLRRLRVWDLGSGAPAREIDTCVDNANVLITSPQGICLSGHKYGGILLWNIETGERIGTLEASEIRTFSRIMADPDEVTALTLTPDGQRLIAGSSKGFLRMWDLVPRRCLQALHAHLMEVRGLALAPDGSCGLSVSWDGTLRNWAREKDPVAVKLFQGKPMINAITLLPVTEQAVWGTEDGELCFWDLRNKVVEERLQGARLGGRDLRGANFKEANLRGARLEGSFLQGAKLHGAELQGATLRGADLSRAVLCGTELQDADLREVDLGEADLSGANLEGADLTGARNLTGQQLLKVRTLYKARLQRGLLQKIESLKPDLLRRTG